LIVTVAAVPVHGRSQSGSAFKITPNATLYESKLHFLGFAGYFHSSICEISEWLRALGQSEAAVTSIASRLSARNHRTWPSHESVSLCRCENFHRVKFAGMVFHFLFYEHFRDAEMLLRGI